MTVLRGAIQQVLGAMKVEANDQKEKAVVRLLHNAEFLTVKTIDSILAGLGVAHNSHPGWLIQQHLILGRVKETGTDVLLDTLLQEVPVDDVVEWITGCFQTLYEKKSVLLVSQEASIIGIEAIKSYCKPNIIPETRSPAQQQQNPQQIFVS